MISRGILVGILCLILGAFEGKAQVIEYDTTTRPPFFAAKKFSSRCHVGFEAQFTQILKTRIAVNTAMHLNWVVNQRYVVSAHYHTLTSPINIRGIAVPFLERDINLKHHFAGFGFSYLFFGDKKFTLQPQLAVGWGSAVFEYPEKLHQRNDYAVLVPALNAVYNASKHVRLGAGVNYRGVLGDSFFGITPGMLSGAGGQVFLRAGTF